MSKLDIIKELGSNAIINFEKFLKLGFDEDKVCVQTILVEYEELLKKVIKFNKKYNLDNTENIKTLNEVIKFKKELL